jgi:hypothetical protein
MLSDKSDPRSETLTAQASTKLLSLRDGWQLDSETRRNLSEVKLWLPDDMGSDLDRACGATSEEVVIREWTTFTERLLRHLCWLCSAEYFSRGPEPIDDLERGLNDLMSQGRKGLSMGHYVGALRQFLTSLSGEWSIRELQQLRTQTLGTECVDAMRAINLVKEARTQFEIPGRKLGAYVDNRLRGSQGGGKQTLVAAAEIIVQLRNEDAHGASRPVATGTGEQTEAVPTWWDKSRDFYRVIAKHLSTLLAGILLWEPVRHALLKLEIVRVIGEPVSDSGGWIALVERSAPPAVRAPGANVVWAPTKELLQRDTRIVARRRKLEGDVLDAVARAAFPARKIVETEALDQYRRAYTEGLCNDGRIDDRERVELTARARQLILAEKQIEAVERDVLLRWRSLWHPVGNGGSTQQTDTAVPTRTTIAPPPLGGANLAALVSWLRQVASGPEPSDDVVKQGNLLVSRLEAFLVSTVENEGIVHVAELSQRGDVGLPEEVVLEVLQRASHESRPDRRIAQATASVAVPDGKGQTSSRKVAYFKVFDSTSTHRFRAALDRLESELKQPGKVEDLRRVSTVVPRVLVEALEIVKESLDGEDARDAQVNLLKLLLRVDDPEADTSAEAESAEDAAEDRISVMIDGQKLEAAGLVALMRKVGEHLKDAWTEIQPHVPFRVGRTRYLLHTMSEHENGSAMGYPIEWQCGPEKLFFEGNWPRMAGLHYINRFLAACGKGDVGLNEVFPEAPAAIPVEHAVPANEELTDDAIDACTGMRGISFVHNDKRVERLGKTVDEFVKSVLYYLVEVAGERLDAHLPFLAGRVRIFLATAPYHRDDQPFRREVFHPNGYYAEASWGWEAAFRSAQKAIEVVFGDEVRDFDVEDYRVQLSIQLADGSLLEGGTVREFFEALVKYIGEKGGLELVPLPFNAQKSSRAFLQDASESRATNTTMCVKTGMRKLRVEIAVSRQDAVRWATELLEAAGHSVDASGEDAELGEEAGALAEAERSGSSGDYVLPSDVLSDDAEPIDPLSPVPATAAPSGLRKQ